MIHSYRAHLWALLSLFGALAAAPATQADAVSAVQLLREGGCGGILPAAQALHRNRLLDRAAEQWAAGRSPAAAAERSGYEAQATAALHIRGPDSPPSSCSGARAAARWRTRTCTISASIAGIRTPGS